MAAMVPRIAFRPNSNWKGRSFGASLLLSLASLQSASLPSPISLGGIGSPDHAPLTHSLMREMRFSLGPPPGGWRGGCGPPPLSHVAERGWDDSPNEMCLLG